MLTKLIFLALLVLFFVALLFPRAIPGLLRKLGRSAGDIGRVGKELATGVEVEGSPLARYEVRAGEIVVLKVLSENPLSKDEGLQRHVAGIGSRLAEHAARKRIPYSFRAVESNEPNAFAVPGGSVFITRPLIDLCEGDPGQVACVLGHEIVHIDRCHAIRNTAASMAVRTGFRVLSLGRAGLLTRLVGGIEGMMEQGYRQDQELEADLFGTRMARLAGFDPRGLTALLEKLRARSPDGEGPLAELFRYFKTHPPAALRIEKLRKEWG